MVKHSWCVFYLGNPMGRLHGKMKRLKANLMSFNQIQFGGISVKVNEKRKELTAVQVSILNTSGNSDLVEREKSLSLELHELMLAEKSFYKQKSRISWIKEGDQNTRFFQKFVTANQHSSTIRALINTDGVKLTSFPQIANEAISFFQKLLGTVDNQVTGCPKHILEELLQSTLFLQEASNLCMPISFEEIKAAMFGIGNEKAPGPDGYSSYFFKVAWSIVKEDVVNAIL